MAKEHILIAGGGIGGLAAALSLAEQGFGVDVFEQAAEFGEIGAGIQLSANCTKVLFGLGLEEPLRKIAFLPEGSEMRDWKSGKTISTSTLGERALQKFGAPYFHVHRADLMVVLAEAAQAHECIRLHTDMEVTTVEQEEGRVTLKAGSDAYTGDVLIGADGIRSVVRSHLFGAEAPTFTGNVAWRGLVPVDRLPKDLIRPVATVWWGPGKHFVHYYVRRGQLVNCVCVVEKDGWEVESWTEKGEHAELMADFDGWHDTIQTLIANMDPMSCYKWALFDRPPMPKWGDGHITLLGDACHPTLPFMAQGAAMAIEDGAVLARCLATGNDVPTSLKKYEDLRRDRTARIQMGSRRNASIFHARGFKAMARNLAAKKAAGKAFDWVYQYDPLTAHLT